METPIADVVNENAPVEQSLSNSEEDEFFPMDFESHWDNPGNSPPHHLPVASLIDGISYKGHHLHQTRPISCGIHNRQSVSSAVVCWFETVPEEDENVVDGDQDGGSINKHHQEDSAANAAGDTDETAYYEEKYKDFKSDTDEKASCWSWVVLLCSCLNAIFILGIPPSFGVIYKEPLDTFKTDATLKSWIFNLAKSLFFLAGCLSGPISTMFGHRIMIVGVIVGFLGLIGSSYAPNPYFYFFTHSILVSMGYGFSHFVCYLNLQKAFPRRRGLATGAYMASKACARAIVPQVANFLAALYGYQWMMRLLAAISLNAVVLGLIVTSAEAGQKTAKITEMAPLNSNNQETRKALARGSTKKRKRCCCCFLQIVCPCSSSSSCGQKVKKSFDFTVFKEPAFIALTTIDCLLGMTMENMSWALPFYAQERGMDALVGATLLSVTAGSELVGRFIIPPLFDVKWLDYQCLFTGLLVVAAGASAGIGIQPNFEVTLALCGIFGLAQSGTGGMPNVLLINHLSVDRFPSSMSAKTLFKFLAFCLMGPVLGYFVDATGSYSTCLFIFSGLLIFTATLSGLFPCVVKRCSQQ